jgi:hypothetical protein
VCVEIVQRSFAPFAWDKVAGITGERDAFVLLLFIDTRNIFKVDVFWFT